MDLSGIWEVCPDPADRGLHEGWHAGNAPGEWKPIAVPAAWETVLGTDFNGIAWYRKRLPIPGLIPDGRVLLRFHGAATEARVWVNGQQVGSHLGAWTPFTLDITPFARPGQLAELIVRLDERVGHNTQGFLPVIAPHFGGLWQGAELICTAAAALDDTALRVSALLDQNAECGTLEVAVPVVGGSIGGMRARFALAATGQEPCAGGVASVAGPQATWRWKGPVRPWEIGNPNLYTLHITLEGPRGETLDAAAVRIGFRHVQAVGDTVLLNNRPLHLRGVLTWGYYPPLLAPTPPVERFRSELRYLRDCGFNLIKFCLWVPPDELLDVVDEEGMACWIEYPTWHPQLDQSHAADLLREYREFHLHDARHPSAIIRSLTCETGPSADLDLMRALYQQAKELAPGTLVEDDSSWIGWNRVHDFWDDHSYGNNRWWRGQLAALREHIRQHGAMPLLLGEAMAADTWADSKALLERCTDGRPWWLPRCLDDQLAFERKLQERFAEPGFDPVADLRQTALRYALEMRRWQIETFRQELPEAGYVVSVIRDVTLCRMGLFDDLDRPKWTPQQWGWHGPFITPLLTAGDQRAFHSTSGARLMFKPCIRAAGDLPRQGKCRLTWDLEGGGSYCMEWDPTWPQVDEELLQPVTLATLGPVQHPRKIRLTRRAEWQDGQADVTSWDFWALPDPPPVPPGAAIYGDPAPRQLETLFPGALVVPAGQAIPSTIPLVITCALSSEVLDYLEGGGRVLHLTSDQPGSLRTEATWFLRGTVWAPPQPHGFFDRVNREMLSYLQLFELGANEVIRGERLWEEVEPLLAFIETHDLDRVRPNLLVFHTSVGGGRLAVSALRQEGGPALNYAGLWLVRELARYLLQGPAPMRALAPDTLQALRESAGAETLHIPTPWRFRVDPTGTGLEQGWERPGLDLSGWQQLLAGSAEEGEIWNRYDGWGWYRQEITVPAHWAGRRVRMVFDSVDDMYELYINGQKAGSHGKLDRSESSFARRTWVDITPYLRFGEANLIVVRAYDWMGAGGIRRPWLTTGPPEEKLDLLRH